MEPSTKRIGKYELWELIGRGAMGAVYRAYDPVLGRTVAIKLMTPAIAADAELRDRFHGEARAAGSLQHPNIITVYDFGEADGHLFIAMEYVAGTDLSSIVGERAPLSLDEKIDLALDVLAGLAYAHRAGVIHRDIKPGNIRVSREGKAKIMDFGVARLADADLTKDGVVVGTPNYMAPEQIKGSEVGPAADLFSLGAVLFELLTYRKPFPGDNTHNVLFKVMTEEPPSLGELCPTLPPGIQRTVEKALAKKPEKRYQRAEDMARELEEARRALEGSGNLPTLFLSERESLALRVKVAARRRGFLVGVGGAATMLAAGLLWALAPGKATDIPQVAQLPPPAEDSTVQGGSVDSAPPDPDLLRDTVISLRAAALVQRAEAESLGVPVSLLGPGDSLASHADSLAAEGRFSQAVVTISSATARWRDAVRTFRQQQAEQARARELAARRRSPRTRRPATAPQRPPPKPQRPPETPSEPVLTTTDRAAVDFRVQRLAQALSSREIERLRMAYPGLTSQEEQSWNRFFETARNVDVALSASNLALHGDLIRASVAGTLRYDERDSGRRREVPARFAATFARRSGSWILTSIRSPQ